MRIFRLLEASYREGQPGPQGNEVWVDRVAYHLPCFSCPQCRRVAGGGGPSLPEAASLPHDHPILQRLRELKRLHEAEVKARGPRLIAPVSLQEFRALERECREALGLPADRVVAPLAALGILPLVIIKPAVTDLTAINSRKLIGTPRFVEWLESSGIQGWWRLPVQARMKKPKWGEPPPLWHLEITGRGGIPAGVEQPFICPECELPLQSPVPHWNFELDVEAWDGSGIFRFNHVWDWMYVTEEVKEAMEAAGFTSVRFEEPTHMPPELRPPQPRAG